MSLKIPINPHTPEIPFFGSFILNSGQRIASTGHHAQTVWVVFFFIGTLLPLCMLQILFSENYFGKISCYARWLASRANCSFNRELKQLLSPPKLWWLVSNHSHFPPGILFFDPPVRHLSLQSVFYLRTVQNTMLVCKWLFALATVTLRK